MAEWITVRTFSATAAESSLPSAGSFVQLDQPTKFVEFCAESLVVANAPTTVVFTFWRLSEGGRRDRIGSQSITVSSELDRPLVQVVEVHGQMIYATVSFTGGASPNITSGSLKARPVFK